MLIELQSIESKICRGGVLIISNVLPNIWYRGEYFEIYMTRFRCGKKIEHKKKKKKKKFLGSC